MDHWKLDVDDAAFEDERQERDKQQRAEAARLHEESSQFYKLARASQEKTLDAKPPARPAAPVTPKPATPVVTPRRRRKTPRRTKKELESLEKSWVHHGSRHAPIVDRPPVRSPRRWRKSPAVPDEDVAYDVEEEEYVKIPVALFKNLSKYFACAKPDFVESARPPDDEEERVIVG